VLHLYATNIQVNKECTFKETAENIRDTEDCIQHHKVPTDVPASMRMRSCKPKPITILSFRKLQAFTSTMKCGKWHKSLTEKSDRTISSSILSPVCDIQHY
jgi:hypothetical protein